MASKFFEEELFVLTSSSFRRTRHGLLHLGRNFSGL